MSALQLEQNRLDTVLAERVDEVAYDLDSPSAPDRLMERIGNAHYVLLGEASHGTSEYYTWRARLSQKLIREKGFSFIAVEGDWPDCYRVNRYIKGYPDAGSSAFAVLHAFNRWPTWMWANWEIVAFAEWLRRHNTGHEYKVGYYGLDVYSLWESMHSIVDYLSKTNDPEAVKLAKQAYRCFEPYSEDPQAYAWSTRMVTEDCEDEVVELLIELLRKTPRYDSDVEGALSAEQNAYIMVNAERYYRAMVRSDVQSWNIRDGHMADTLDRLMKFHGPDAKGIVWAHNTHVGDARATDMARVGMQNIGQMVRERHQAEGVVLAGFASYRGTVIAGREWGAPMERMPLPEAQQSSWEDILHRARTYNKLLVIEEFNEDEDFLASRGHRAIGVVYDPATERFGNYVPTVLPNRYDALLYLDKTEALHPLHIEPVEGMPDTFPWGL